VYPRLAPVVTFYSKFHVSHDVFLNTAQRWSYTNAAFSDTVRNEAIGLLIHEPRFVDRWAWVRFLPEAWIPPMAGFGSSRLSPVLAVIGTLC
jgi:hypothetical protein